MKRPSSTKPGRLESRKPQRDWRLRKRLRHYEAPEAEEALEEAPVVVQPILVATPGRVRAPTVRAAPGSKSKAAFTLRLDPERHLKLRLACAVDGRSAQQLVTDALDQLLERMPDLDGLAAKAKSRG